MNLAQKSSQKTTQKVSVFLSKKTRTFRFKKVLSDTTFYCQRQWFGWCSRVVDVGLVIAIGMNAAFVDEFSSGLIAAVLTLFGSYMGTQSQSVGLDRIYGGFSRADRMVLTLACLIAAAWQAYSGGAGIDVSGIGYADWLMLGNMNLNGMTAALAVSAWGGVYTFLVRFVKTRNQLLG